MDIVSFILDVLKLFISGALLIGLIYLLFRSRIDTWNKVQVLNYKRAVNKELLPLKLQAFERMTLFVERINPGNLLLRLHTPGMTARQMQRLILEEVKAEYNHNLAQQLYISEGAWQIIKRVKDNTITLVNKSTESLPEGASAVDLSKVIFANLEDLEENPYDLALLVIKNQLQGL